MLFSCFHSFSYEWRHWCKSCFNRHEKNSINNISASPTWRYANTYSVPKKIACLDSATIQLNIFLWIALFEPHTGGPCYMREIGTQKIGSHIMNSHIKRPRITVNLKIGSRKMAISQWHIRKIADKKVAYNEGRLYV